MGHCCLAQAGVGSWVPTDAALGAAKWARGSRAGCTKEPLHGSSRRYRTETM
jgi:hypothetical protein